MMKIILTHEQADFDALASLLGAHLLDEATVPVLPRRLNRNVQAFLTLYGMDLPFVEPGDLPDRPIEAATLVDTQSLTSIKGMREDIQVSVIDHHPPRPDLTPEWSVTTTDTGATTTLFVEVLQERRCVLTMTQATLLLLGIYEDTGSLTYTRTTTRDLRAVTFLLESGASLDIAVDFLEHPLSLGQQELYDHLRASAETHRIHGHTVIVTCGEAQNLDEEISTIAHKLRDLLDPDGLFLLVTTVGGVQLIARSTSDFIDVGKIASHFNGGGHERAAAALIRDGDKVGSKPIKADLRTVYEELLRVLPELIRPALTVAQIMSHRPQVIAPDTPAEEIARRMQRYGYEGFPVVSGDKVIGLVTRRAVDRALGHRLNYTASRLMQAGEVTVAPDDPIEHLQKLMIATGWGQIPVVDPQSKEIIGIVTRTDLIKTLTPEPRVTGQLNLSERLESALPPIRLALLKTVSHVAHQQGSALYIVGGFTRDLLLERPSLDFDLVVEGDAIRLARALARQYGGRVTSHARFGTAKWHISEARDDLAVKLLPSARTPVMPSESLPDTLDLVTARTEFYTYPTALPTVERGSIKLDLHRRDFTINTLALRLDGRHYGELYDYWGGLNDLRQGLVRVLHSLSFVDDPTRLLRAVRFEQRFDFQIEDRTLELLQEARPLLNRVSGDRIRHELDAILAEERVAQMMVRLAELELLEAIHPELIWDGWLKDRFALLPSVEPPAAWGFEEVCRGAALHQALGYALLMIRPPVVCVREVIERLKIPNDLGVAVLAACQLWRDLSTLEGQRPSQIVARLENVPQLALYAVFIASDDPSARSILDRFASQWRKVSPTLNGHDLRALGLPPGPIYRRALTALRNAWLDGEISSQEEETAFLERFLDESSKDSPAH